MPAQYILIRQIIDDNRRALADETLGAFNNSLCMYEYPDGSRCAIGACLTSEALQAVRAKKALYSSVFDLMRHNIASFQSVSVALVTQGLHDAWASGNPFFVPTDEVSHLVDPRLREFIENHERLVIDQEKFTAWIDLLDEVFPAPANG